MKKVIERIRTAASLAVLLALDLASAGLADATANNPVTGASESYTYKYVGSESDSTWEAVANWRNADDTAYSVASGLAPNLSDSNVWTPLLFFDGSTFASGASKSVSATTIEGYMLNLGIFNGAQVTIGTLSKWQGGCKVRVDDNSSSLTISALGSKTYGGAVDYYVAGANGVTYSCAFNKDGNTHNYYLTGAGSVSYQAISAGTHVIKQADVALDGGTKARKSKTLVSFTSSSISFSADATIYVKDSGGTTKRTITATQITSSTPTISTDYPVGTCELVQESGGIKLYYIDGDYDTDFVAYIGDDPTANKYHTIVEAAAAIAEDNTLVKLTLLSSTEESFVVPSVGFVFDTNGKTVTGTISGASGVGLTEMNGVYTGIANTASTWTGSASDGLWENAQNWSTKSVPTSETTVSFDADAIVNLPYDTAEAYGVQIAEGYTLTLRRAGQTPGTAWATFKVGGGGVSGNGTLKLVAAGINKKMVGQFTINANIVFENDGTHDSFLEENTSGSFTINGTVTGTGYLHIKTSTTFNGDVTIPSGSLVKVNSYTYTLGDGAGLYGAGTLKFDTVEPSATMKTALQNKDRWTGVCEIYNKELTHINAANFGNVNSTVRYNKVTGYSAFSAADTVEVGNVKCIDIGSEGLTFNNTFSSNNFGYTFAGALTGTGTITFGTSYGGSGTYTFTGDASAFAGTISFGSLDADKRAAVIFNSTDATAPTVGKGQIGIAAGTTVGLAGFSGTVVGEGTINGISYPSTIGTFDSTSWTGEYNVNWSITSGAFDVNRYGTSQSTVVLKQAMTAGYYTKAGNFSPTLRLDAAMTSDNGYPNDTVTFAAIAGDKNLAFNANVSGNTTYAITKFTDYTGTLSTSGKSSVNITTVNVGEIDLASAEPILKVATGTTINTAIDDIAVTVDNQATSHKLYKAADGNLYVKVASVTVNDTTTYYPTLQAAADAAMAAGGDTITFTRIDSSAATSLAGWTYEDGVFTRTGYAYNATTETEYPTLADAVAAASEGETIQLMYPNAETSVDTTGKDFVFDENGYAFTGTWTGSGRIVLSTKPSSTTWGANRFVSTAANEGEPVWTGTVAVDWGTVAERDNSALYSGNVYTLMTAFGTANSTVEIGENSKTVGNCYFGNTPSPKLKVSGCLYINDGAANTPQTIANVTGSGVLVFGDKANTVNYNITTLQDWAGIMTNLSSKVSVGTITGGDGVIYWKNKPSSFATFTETEGQRWTGRFVAGWTQATSALFDANAYGVSGSTVMIADSIRGFFASGATINPTIDIAGTLIVDNGYSGKVVTLTKVAGSGTLKFDCIYTHNIQNLVDWNGSLEYVKSVSSSSASTASGTISSISSGMGTVKFGYKPSTAPNFDNDWSGTFAINWTHSSGALNLNDYGTSKSTVRIDTDITGGYLGNGGNSAADKIHVVLPRVNLQANMSLTSGWANANAGGENKTTFVEMTGSGNFVTWETGYSDPYVSYYGITTLSNYTGTITVNNRSALDIGTVKVDAGPEAGAPYVSVVCNEAYTDGNSTVHNAGYMRYLENTTLAVNGISQSAKLAYATINTVSGLYKAVASYNTSYYATMTEAIAAAVADGQTYAAVTILDNTAECPAGYYIVNDTLAKKPASITVGENVYYYTTIQAAVADTVAIVSGGTGGHTDYDYLTIYESNATVTMMDYTLKLATASGVTGVTVALPAAYTTSEFAVTSDQGATYTTYSVSVNPKTYRRKSAAAGSLWTTASNWEFQDNETWTSAQRYPGDGTTGDSVVVAADTSIQLGQSVTLASLQVTDGTLALAIPSQGTATTLTASAITLAGTTAAISVTDVTLSPVPTTTVADSYVKATTSGSTTTYAVDAYNTVTFEGANMTARRTDMLGTDIKDGDTITFTIAPAEGYVVTGVTATLAGGSPETLTADNNGVYSYVVNGNVVIAVTAARVATVAEPSFDVYYADYSKAQTVTVAASDYVKGSIYTLQVGNGAAVRGVYENGKVTFAEVTGFTPGAAVNYTITVSGAAAGTKSGTVTAAAPAVSGWVNETKTTIGTASATGTWSPDAPAFGNANSAALSGETTFTANSQASGKVTLTTVVNFGNEAAPTIEIGADAKAAIKVENNSFKIWTKTTVAGEKGASADWLTVSGAEPNLAAGSTVVFTFDTDAKTFTVSVGGNALYYGASNANTSFAFASDGVAISSVAYKGAGSFTSLTGEYTTTDVTTSVDGKQVVVANSFISGNAALREMTVAEAAAALAPDATLESNPAAFAAGGNGLNYFKCYALGLDPTKADDKPIVDVTTDTEGKFVFTVKHRNAAGELVAITPADNVSTTVTLKYGTDASSITTVEEGAASGISPAEMFDHAGAGNVLYYKAEVTIGAK